MDRLPSEIIDLIILYCTHADQKTCRLVSHDFHDAASALVFEHVYLGYFPHLLANFCRLAKSRCAKSVKKLTFCSDLLPNWDRHEWQGKIDLRGGFAAWSAARLEETRRKCPECQSIARPCPDCKHSVEGHMRCYRTTPTCPLHPKQLDEAWTNYKRLRYSQHAWREDREGKVFTEHFSLLPNLEEACATCSKPFNGPTNSGPVWKALGRSILVGPDNWMFRHMGEIDTHTAEHMEGQAALALLEAIGYRSQFAGTKQICKLTVETSHRTAYVNMMAATIGHANSNGAATVLEHQLRFLNIVETFKHLTELSMNVDDAASGGDAVAKEICALLRQAMQLRRLNLVYTDDEWGRDDTRIRLDDLFGGASAIQRPGPIWSHLQHLALRTTVRYPDFLSFLQAHAETLQSLELRDMLVGDVQRLLTSIPKILDLKHVYVECLWGHADENDEAGGRNAPVCYLARGTDYDDEYEMGVKMFLLGQIQRMPKVLAEGQAAPPEGW